MCGGRHRAESASEPGPGHTMVATHTHLALELLLGLLFLVSLIIVVVLAGGLFPFLAALAPRHAARLVLHVVGIVLIVAASLLLRGCRRERARVGLWRELLDACRAACGLCLFFRFLGLLHDLLFFRLGLFGRGLCSWCNCGGFSFGLLLRRHRGRRAWACREKLRWKWERLTNERSLVFGHALAVKHENK